MFSHGFSSLLSSEDGSQSQRISLRYLAHHHESMPLGVPRCWLRSNKNLLWLHRGQLKGSNAWFTFCHSIWVEIIRMRNMHFLCHFLSVFFVTWIQTGHRRAFKKYTKESKWNALILLQVGLN